MIGAAIASTGQSLQEKVDKCKSADPDTSITGCTAIIQERLLTRLLPNERLSALYYNRGNAYRRKSNYDQAIQDYDEAVRLTPTDADVYYGRGSAYRDKGDYDHAIQDFNEAIRLNPKDEGSYYGRGLAYFDKEDYDPAIQDFSDASHLNPNDTWAYYGRGSAYYDKGDYDQAIQNYNEAIRLDPKFALAYKRRGDAYFAKSNLTAAIADFEHAISTAPSSNNAVFAALMLHVIMKRQGRDDAQQLARAAAAADLSKWPGPMLKLDMGQMTADEVMKSAASPVSYLQKWHVCDANYFTGEDALFHHQRATALARLMAARDGCPKGAAAYGAAMAELKRQGAMAAPAK